MTIKELVYSAQQHLQSVTGASFKRAHIYELLAASFGFNSHASFGVDTVLTELQPNSTSIAWQSALIKRRCIELGYQPDIVILTMSALESFLVERQIGVTSISSLINRLRGESPNQEGDLEYNEAIGPILLNGLDTAASKGNGLAHYALALIYATDDEDDVDAGNSYWYSQSQRGRVLSGVEIEWAEAYEFRLVQAEKYTRHLKEAAQLGNQDALLDLADQFDDPSFFEQSCHDVDVDPAEIAAIAERMGRTTDARRWLIHAAEGGDTDAMLQLIEEHEKGDIPQCWIWVYLAKLVGTDLTQDTHRAIHEDGSDYDDDVGGPLYVAGNDGVNLVPLAPAQDMSARLAAQKLFEQIERKRGEGAGR